MVEINGKHLCENCFEETTTPVCPHCGYNAAADMTDPTMLKPGSVLLGKYIVGKIMGKGGFGVTYLAYDITAGRKVAIKEFFPYGVALRAAGTTTVSVASMDNAEAFKLGAEKFYNEAKLVSKFNGNPNIVGVYEFFYENDTVYFAMEYLKGKTLKDYIAEHGTLSAAQALFITQNVANALMAAHSSNVLHRDISPDNIIICDNGDIKLIDFGAARQVVAEHSQSFSVILKPGFAPLEQYQKKGNQGPWTDIYSLGATIYYTLTTDIPEDPMSRLDDDEAYSSNQYGVDPELWGVISKATELKIESRYGDIFQLKNDLAKISYEAEPLVTAQEQQEDKMPEFQTAMPFGMTQAVTQTQKQAVGAGAPITGSAPAVAMTAGDAEAAQKKKTNIALIAALAYGVISVIVTIVIFASCVGSLAKGRTETVYDQDFTDLFGTTFAYTGDWKNDMPNGEGKAVYYNGNVYEGEWQDGMQTGQGKMTFSDGDVYEGEFKSGEFSGKGVYTWAEGQIYNGEWKGDLRNGSGFTYIVRAGDATSWIRSGTYTDGSLTSGGFLSINGNNYEFTFGDYDSDGELSGSNCYNEWRNSSGEITYRNGTLKNGNLVQGEKMICYEDSTLLFVGTWNPETTDIRNAYGIKFDKSGTVMGGWKYTEGKSQVLSASEVTKNSELKKYNAKYISNVTSNHYDHKSECDSLTSKFQSVGGPKLY